MQHSRFNSVRFAFALQLINTSLHRNTISNKLNKAKEKYIWGEQREKQQKCVTQIYERTEMQKSTLCIKKAAKKFVCCFLVLCNKFSFFFVNVFVFYWWYTTIGSSTCMRELKDQRCWCANMPYLCMRKSLSGGNRVKSLQKPRKIFCFKHFKYCLKTHIVH